MAIRQATIAELVLLGLALIIIIAFIAQKTFIQSQAQFIVPCSNTGIYTYDDNSRQCILSQVCIDNMPQDSYATCDSCRQANSGALPVCAINGGTYFINFQTGPENNVYATCTTINNSNAGNFNLTSPDSKVVANDQNPDGTFNGYGTNSSCFQSNTSSNTPSFNFNQYNRDENIGIKCNVQGGFSICDTSTDTDNTCIPLTTNKLNKLPSLPSGSNLYVLDPMAYPDTCQMYTVCDFQGTTTSGATGYYFNGQQPSGPGIYTFLGNDPSVCSNICFTETPNYYEYQLTSSSGIESNPQFKTPQPDTYISVEFNVSPSNCTGANQSNSLPNPICPSGMYFNSNSQNNNNSCCFSTGLNETCDGGYYVLEFDVSPGTPISCTGPASSQAYSTNGSQVAFNFQNDCINFVENYLQVPSGETRFNALNPTVGVTCNPTTSTQFCDLSSSQCTGYNGSFWIPTDVQADKTSFPCVLYTNCNDDQTYPTQYNIGLPGSGWVTGSSQNCPNNPPAPGSTKYVCIPDITFNAFTSTTGFCRVAVSGDTGLVDDCSMCAPTGTYCENTSNPTNSVSCAYAYALNNPDFCDNTTNPAVPTCSTTQVCGVDSVYYNQDSLLPNYAACPFVAPKYVFTAQNENCLTTTLNGETDPSSCCVINPELAPYINDPSINIPLMKPPTPATCISSENAFNALTPCSSTDINCIYNSNPNWGNTYTFSDYSSFLPNFYGNVCGKTIPGSNTCLISDFMQICAQPIQNTSNYYIQPANYTPFYNYTQNIPSTPECATGYTLTTINNANNAGGDMAGLEDYFYNNYNTYNLTFNCYPDNCITQQNNYSNNYLSQNICNAPNCS